MNLEIDGCEIRIVPDKLADFQACGKEWLQSVVNSVRLTYPDTIVELRVLVQDSEPMENYNNRPTWLLPERSETSVIRVYPLDRRRFDRGEPLQDISHIGKDNDVPVLERVLNLPSKKLRDAGCAFTFLPRITPLRTAISVAFETAHKFMPTVLDELWQRRNSINTEPPIVQIGALPGLVEPYEKQRCVWVAMHWLENGGAEVWAFDQIRIAKELGWKVIVTVDRCSPQHLFDTLKNEVDEVYLVANGIGFADWGIFAERLIRIHGVSRLHLHHSLCVYMLLPELKRYFPDLEIIDSTHILEHRGGGFPAYSAHYQQFIDRHHVISPQLVEYLQVSGVPRNRIDYFPLTHFSSGGKARDNATAIGCVAEEEVTASTKNFASSRPLVIGFLGRLAMQKRPFLFVELVRRMHRKCPGQFHFVMQGSGELEQFVQRQIRKAGLEEVIERRPWGSSDKFLRDVDILVICSDNEGLTLTALEADVNNTLVLSADVGSQRTVTVPEMLLPQLPFAFLKAACSLLHKLADRRDIVLDLLSKQRAQVDELRSIQNAGDYARSLYGKDAR